TAITDRDTALFVERVSKLLAILEPVSGVFGEGLGEHAVEAGQLRALVTDRLPRMAEDLAGGAPRVRIEHPRSTGPPVERGGRQRVLGRAAGDVGAHQLFRRGVGDSADRRVGPGTPDGITESPGYPKIGQQNSLLTLPRACQQDVGGFDIAVQQPALMRVV